MANRLIKTAEMSARLRARAIDVENERLLISYLAGSDQEPDITEPINCGGYGRIRHFKLTTSLGWPPNPLPIVPAAHALGVPVEEIVRAQVFQNAACNWRCWYCYVPYNLLNADPKRSTWMTAHNLVELYLADANRPAILDLSGGSPDLVPEWVPWMMRALRDVGVEDEVYLWSDDNLSTDYVIELLPAEEIELMCSYRNYGRVCCFKGFDAESFAFNTGAQPEGWERQFEIMDRHLDLGIDVYCYVTLTGPSENAARDQVRRFIDRLQGLDANLPLRVVPLEIRGFSPMRRRMNERHRAAIEYQQRAIDVWMTELEDRFDGKMRALPIASVPLAKRVSHDISAP